MSQIVLKRGIPKAVLSGLSGGSQKTTSKIHARNTGGIVNM